VQPQLVNGQHAFAFANTPPQKLSMTQILLKPKFLCSKTETLGDRQSGGEAKGLATFV